MIVISSHNMMTHLTCISVDTISLLFGQFQIFYFYFLKTLETGFQYFLPRETAECFQYIMCQGAARAKQGGQVAPGKPGDMGPYVGVRIRPSEGNRGWAGLWGQGGSLWVGLGPRTGSVWQQQLLRPDHAAAQNGSQGPGLALWWPPYHAHGHWWERSMLSAVGSMFAVCPCSQTAEELRAMAKF